MDCICERARSLYIHPGVCVDCGACEPVCAVEAVDYEDDLREELQSLADNDAFFHQALPGRDTPLGSPGGAQANSEPWAQTPPLVAALPPQGG